MRIPASFAIANNSATITVFIVSSRSPSARANLDAANILFNVLKVTGGQGVTVGPILLGVNAPAHILTPSATVRRVVNMTAFTVAHAVALAALKKA